MFQTTPKYRETNVRYRGGNRIKEFIFESERGFKREDIQKYVDNMRNEYLRLGFKGDIQVALWYDKEQRFFSNGYMNIEDPIRLFSFEANYEVEGIDPKRHEKVLIRVSKTPTTNGKVQGKKGENNDCLYNCLKELVPDLKKIWVNDFYFKKYLGLDKKDGVDVSKIKLIEKELKDYKINVNGDDQYISIKKAKYELFLLLVNEHYTIDKKKMWKNRISDVRKEPLVYKKSPDDYSKIIIFGSTRETRWKVGHCEWERKDFLCEKRNYYYGHFCFIEAEKDESMKEKYLEFIINANKLLEITNGRIDLYKTGGDFRLWSLELFKQMTPNIQPEELKADEAEWLENAKCGPLAWARRGYKGEGYKYDVISEYGAIMRHQNFSVPIKRGEFRKITKEEFENMDYYLFGIYRAKITGSKYKLFRNNSRNFYTHYELTLAKKRGYEIELIEDEKPNFLYYDKDTRVNGNKMFREFVDYVFFLKQKGIGYSKKILNSLWGAMIQKNKIRKYIKKDEELIIEDSLKLADTIDHPNGYEEHVLLPISKIYVSDFARIGPFILAFARKMISEIIEPFIQDVVRLHTDGWISKKPCKFNKKGASISCVKEGNDIGNIRYEGYCDYINIIHCNEIIGKDGKRVLGKNEKLYWLINP